MNIFDRYTVELLNARFNDDPKQVTEIANSIIAQWQPDFISAENIRRATWEAETIIGLRNKLIQMIFSLDPSITPDNPL